MPILQFHLDDRSPFTLDFTLAKNARLPDLEVQLLDGSTAEDLTGATVTFSMVTETGTVKVSAAAAVLTDGPTGKVKYLWAAADVDTEGTFFGQFVITVSSKDYRVPNNDDQRLRILIGPRIN